MKKNTEKAVLGGGCFWCVEAVFEKVNGVQSAISGYAGGQTSNPLYDAVCSGKTGHAEVVEINFDPNIISYREILEIFFATHDPTTLNRQGNDVGTQYRSVIYYTNEKQQKTALETMKEVATLWDNPIITEIEPLSTFYEAEAYHQDYFERNPNQGYCTFVINPKLEKFKKKFWNKLK